MNIFENWEGSTEEEKKIYAQELLIAKVTETICAQMKSKRIRKTDLAEMLGRSRAYLTKLLEGNHNMTLRTLADISYAMGVNAEISFDGKDANWKNDIDPQYVYDTETVSVSEPQPKIVSTKICPISVQDKSVSA